MRPFKSLTSGTHVKIYRLNSASKDLQCGKSKMEQLVLWAFYPTFVTLFLVVFVDQDTKIVIHGNYSFLNLEILRWYCPKVTLHKCGETIQGRKLFRGRNYMRKYGIYSFYWARQDRQKQNSWKWTSCNLFLVFW